MRKFEGVKVDGNFGFGTTIKGFQQWDASIIAGKSWSSGNAYVSVTHAERDSILNGEAPWVSPLSYNAAGVGSLSGTQCPSPVGTQIKYKQFAAGSWTNNPLASGAGTFPVGTPCDLTSAAAYSPQQKRTNVFAALSQEVAENIDLRVTAYWAKRDTTIPVVPRGYTTDAQTFVPPAAGVYPVNTILTVLGGTAFSFSPNAAYVNTPQRVGLTTWGVTPELDIKLGGSWQLRTTAHFGRSTNFQSFPGVDTNKAKAYVNNGQLNPLDVASASAAVISDITNYENAQQTIQQLFAIRTVADGSLFPLPGGDAKLAVGLEYQDNGAKSRLTTGLVGSVNTLPYISAQRNSKSVFAELSLPLVDFVNVTGSLRYDNYSDFGSTTNPNIGVTFTPAPWLKVFGHWGTSFNAPTAVDDLAISTARVAPAQYSATKGPTDPFGKFVFTGSNTDAVILEGATAGLKPQTSTAWAVGFEANPLSGLRFGGEYYSIDIDGLLGAINPADGTTYTTNPEFYYYSPSDAVYAGLLGQITNGQTILGTEPASKVGLLIDRRTSNLGSGSLAGIDFHAYYDTDVSFGHLAFGISGTLQTKSLVTFNGVTANKRGIGGSRLSASTFAAWNKDGMSARVTVNYSGKYTDDSLNNVGVFETIDPFVVTNLNLGYKFEDADGPLNGTSFRLTVDNLFDTKPQTILLPPNSSALSYRGWTLGRVIKLGFSKQF